MTVFLPATRTIGRPEAVEGLLRDHRRDVAADAAALDRLLGDHQPAGPADRVEDAADVHRDERAQVDRPRR